MAPGSDAIGNAAGWVTDLAGGSLATILAVLAVASIGVLMLGGHLPARRGALTVLGVFLLFGAGTLARSLVQAAGLSSGQQSEFATRQPAPAEKERPADDRYAHPSLIAK